VTSASMAYQVGHFVDGKDVLRAGRRLLELSRIRPTFVCIEVRTDSHAGPARYAWLPEGATLQATYPAEMAAQISSLVEGQPDVQFEPIPFDNAEYLLRLPLECPVVPLLRDVPPVEVRISGRYPVGTVEQRLVELATHDRAELTWLPCHWPGTPDDTFNLVELNMNGGLSSFKREDNGHHLVLHVGAEFDASATDAKEDTRYDALAAQLALNAGLSITGRQYGWG
jgi:hypothetical protein